MKPMRIAPEVVLTEVERSTLTRWSRGRSVESRLVVRAKIVLLAAEGLMNKQIAEQVGARCKTVCLWRSRFVEDRLAGIEKDAPRGGRPPLSRDALARRIIEKTTQGRPENATHWSTRSLAKELGT